MNTDAQLLNKAMQCLTLLAMLFATTAFATDELTQARQAWQLLDYIAVDYAGAVRDGEVIDAAEYAEMREFATLVNSKLKSLPVHTKRDALLNESAQLIDEIDRRVPPERVAAMAAALADRLIIDYQIPATPSELPDVQTAVVQYAQHCASCHGSTGEGDGPLAKALNPRPIDFTDIHRASQRSPFALYQVITHGLDGTAMAAYPQLSESQRWALAFYIGGFAYDADQVEHGRSEWRDDPRWQKAISDMATLSSSSAASLSQLAGLDAAHAVTAYLRSEPEAVVSNGRFSLTRQKLAQSRDAYARGDVPKAQAAALSAYLDGIEPYEAVLAASDRALMRKIELAMSRLRAQMNNGVTPEQLQSQLDTIETLLTQAEQRLTQSQANATTAYLGSLTILLREGLEALLIVIGMIAFLRKAERQEVSLYVHAGWLTALLAGGMTWGIATQLVSISGASRELTEGFSALFAAAVLLSVGIWMHQKSQAGRWQEYLHSKVSAALNRRSALFLFVLAFVAVYREVFETILFLVAMWSEQNEVAIVAGLLSGTAVLALLAYWMLGLSARLPIAQFFRLSSLLIAVLAIMLVGKGVVALQEAGWMSQSLVDGPRVDWLGIYPSWQSLSAQVMVALIIGAGFWLNKRALQARHRSPLTGAKP